MGMFSKFIVMEAMMMMVMRVVEMEAGGYQYAVKGLEDTPYRMLQAGFNTILIV